MNLFDINGWEFIIILVVALLVIGPERLPEYSAKLTKMVRQVRSLADAAKVQLREQMGSEFDDVDWKQYDPRQYDPRRIVREALMGDAHDDAQSGEVKAQSTATEREPNRATPYDEDST